MLQNFFLRRLQYNRQARRFFMTIVAVGFALDGVYAVLLNLYLLRLGYGPQFIGQVNAIGLFTFALVSLPAGIMGTWWTSTRMLRVGLGSIFLGTLLLPLAEFSPQGWQAGWFIVTYAMTLTGFSLFFVNGAPFLMSVVKRDNQSGAFAIQTALLSLAAFGGSLFGGVLPVFIANVSNLTLDDPQPYRNTLMLVAVVILVALLITMTIVEQPEDDDDALPVADEPTAVPTKKGGFTTAVMGMIGVMSLVRFLQVAGLATTSVYFNVYLDTEFALPSSTIGIVASIGRLLTVPTVLLAPRLIRRTSTGSVALWGSLATALCLLPLALVPNWGVAALGFVGALAATNLRFTAFIVYIMLLVPKRQQAVMAGAGETAAGFSFAVMALGGGYIATLLSFRHLFFLGSLLSGLGTIIFWLHLHKVRPTLRLRSPRLKPFMKD